MIYFKLFDNCNLKCNMCDCWSSPRFSPQVDRYLEMLDRSLPTRPRRVRFTGGEVLMYEDLPELVRRVADSDVRASIITNGLLLGRRLPGLVESGLGEVVLSIDGIADVHDHIRGRRRAFGRLDASLRQLFEADVEWGVNTVLQAANIDAMDAVLDYLAELPRRPAWWHLIPVRGNPSLNPTSDQVAQFEQRLPELVDRAGCSGIQLVAGSQRLAGAPCNVPSFVCYVNGETGDVHGCNMLAYTSAPLGNLTSDDLLSITRSAAADAQRAVCQVGRNPACGTCDQASREMNQLFRVG